MWRSLLGCFDPALQQIVINRQLDREIVPEFVVAYVMYHEMLHVKHPMKFARCRRESHSAGISQGRKEIRGLRPRDEISGSLPRSLNPVRRREICGAYFLESFSIFFCTFLASGALGRTFRYSL